MKLKTMDGSETLYNEEYKEYYHSKSGAVEESVEKYVKPCNIKELAEKGHVCILDIGFGLGYNAIAAVDTALKSNKNSEIEIISLEKNLRLEDLKNIKNSFKHYKIIEKLEFDPITKSYIYEDKNIFLKIKIGDASLEIKKLKKKFDAVFHDPFSPSKNPELWTADFFKDVFSLMKQDAVLATYSYARKVRDNLREAGFEVYDGPVVGRRSPCTLARAKHKTSLY